MLIRPMREEDVPAAERLSAEAFLEVDRRVQPRSWPEPAARTPSRAEHWVVRTRHLLGTDPGGCWVAEDDDGLAGFAVSFRRELMWVLASYGVRPGRQGRGVGRQLLDAALHHGRGCLRGMLSASADQAAVRRYHAAGFELHPQMRLRGTVRREAIPVVEKVREATPGDRELLDSVDRRTRGAAHGADHDLLATQFRLLVSDTSTGSGYAYVDRSGCPQLLAASNRRTARRLLWAVLADAPGEVSVPHVTAANAWAVDVGLAARLELHLDGYLGLRGMKPPAPYLHHGSLL